VIAMGSSFAGVASNGPLLLAMAWPTVVAELAAEAP
jgi:hypothetical protein